MCRRFALQSWDLYNKTEVCLYCVLQRPPTAQLQDLTDTCMSEVMYHEASFWIFDNIVCDVDYWF